MTKRARNLIDKTAYANYPQPAIFALVEFAAQNSGIEWGDYGGDGKAYREEARSITQDWQRFKSALSIAAIEGVMDSDVIAAAPHAFSGRLEWKSQKAIESRMTDPAKYGGTHKGGIVKTEVDVWDWEYTTGQYFCTEYRKAAATVLEYATRAVRQARPAAKERIESIADLRRLNEKNGGCWFQSSEMRFFGTRIESGIIRGKYFVTSEQQDEGRPRKFSLRSFDDEGSVDTVGKFHSFSTKADAIAAIDKDQAKAA